VKIFVAVPHYGDVKAKFAECLGNLIAATPEHEIRVVFEEGLLPINRNILAVKALAWGAEAVLWADADMTFRPDALARLLKRNVAIVGVNGPRRDTGESTAGNFNGSERATLIAPKAEGLEQVEQMGLGLVLIEASALKELQDEAVREGMPLFHFELQPSGSYLGEDNFFFARARRRGFKVYVDHAVSSGVGHIGEHISTHAGRADADTVVAPAGAQ
jgi:hypothetical protein